MYKFLMYFSFSADSQHAHSRRSHSHKRRDSLQQPRVLIKLCMSKKKIWGQHQIIFFFNDYIFMNHILEAQTVTDVTTFFATAAAAAAQPSDRFVNTEQQLRALLATNPLSFAFVFISSPVCTKKEKKWKHSLLKPHLPGVLLKKKKKCEVLLE